MPSALVEPPPASTSTRVELVRGPNIAPLPDLDGLPDALTLEVMLSLGDNISTDEILPAGARVLPFRSNVERIADFCFAQIDPGYPERCRKATTPHAIIAGQNYGQGSSREHAALSPRVLGLRCVVAISFARIHRQNLINFGVLPLTFVHAEDRAVIQASDVLTLRSLGELSRSGEVLVGLQDGREVRTRHDLWPREIEIVRAGGRLAHYRLHAQPAAHEAVAPAPH